MKPEDSETTGHAQHECTLDELSRINNELVNAQRQLAQKNLELENLAAEHARLYAEANDLLQMQNAFLVVLTHDLKTPLSTIIGYAQTLAWQIPNMTVPDQARILTILQHIETAAKSVNRQVNELLDIAQLQQGGRLRFQREEVDLLALVQQVCTRLQPGAMQHKITVKSPVPSVVGAWDAHQLERMFANLLSNAIKYSPEGGNIVVEVEVEAAEAAAGACTVVRVHDQGMGILPSDLPHIFDLFHRGRNTLAHADGTGIGLFSVRSIVDQHGGTIVAESQEGAGTTFTVRLPLESVASNVDTCRNQ
jgi:signal transduction histidine kinase